ncbi:MAG TPA: RNA polymerase sigma factor RpoD/SigA [Verrucomicrobiae bacterium]|jgi:RNA polymerase primary sigma factor
MSAVSAKLRVEDQAALGGAEMEGLPEFVPLEELRGRTPADDGFDDEEEEELSPESIPSDPLHAYVRDIWNMPMMRHEELVEVCRRIEAAEENLRRIIYGFGFAAREHVALADKLLADPPRERFDRVVLDRETEHRAAYLGSLAKLTNQVRQIDQEADQHFAAWTRTTGAGRREQLWAELDGCGERIRALLPQFAFKHRVTEELAELAATFQRDVQHCRQHIQGLKHQVRSPLQPSPFACAHERQAELEQLVRMPAADFLLACEQMRWFLNDIEQSKSQIVLANLRLVIFIARKFVNRGLPVPDLIQEGNIGLMKAVDRFEYRRGYKFSTYARWWIQQAVVMSIANQSRTIRLPAQKALMISRLLAVRNRLQRELRRDVTPEELAGEMHVPLSQVRALLKAAWASVSLQATVNGDADRELGELIPDPSTPDMAAEIDEHLMHDKLCAVLATLKDKERRVLELRFGLNDHEPHTLDEVGQRYNLTRERIRQIEARALKKLRHPERLQHLSGNGN